MPFSWDEIRELSIAERIQLAGDIWDSIVEENAAPPLTEAQKKELDRRLAEHERNPSATLSWEEVRERLDRER